ncbi:MAG TPA: response regulator [bacterium]|nr:response regulator [bacterium]
MASILSIDDEKQVMKILRQMLEREGYKAMEASNGGEKMSLYSEHPTECCVNTSKENLIVPV